LELAVELVDARLQAPLLGEVPAIAEDEDGALERAVFSEERPSLGMEDAACGDALVSEEEVARLRALAAQRARERVRVGRDGHPAGGVEGAEVLGPLAGHGALNVEAEEAPSGGAHEDDAPGRIGGDDAVADAFEDRSQELSHARLWTLAGEL
jgi:hypothetical protein